MCNPHYFSQYRYGDPLASKRRKRGGCKIDGCPKPHSGLGWCKEHYDRWLRCGDPLATFEPRTDIGYGAAHMRVRELRGAATAHPCQRCGGVAAQWAYDHSDPEQREDLAHGPYSLDPERYDPLCVPCHKRFDLARLAGTPIQLRLIG
jgi:hypothetical protein